MTRDSNVVDSGRFRQRSATQTWAPNAELFAQKAGLNPFPDTYAHRGATTADLNPNMLHSIHTHISTHIGGEAAESYVHMIKDIPYLSAEAFLTMLYILEGSAWKWDKSYLLGQKEFSSKPKGASGAGDTAMLRDETHYIKSQFMKLLRSSDQGVTLDKYSW